MVGWLFPLQFLHRLSVGDHSFCNHNRHFLCRPMETTLSFRHVAGYACFFVDIWQFISRVGWTWARFGYFNISAGGDVAIHEISIRDYLQESYQKLHTCFGSELLLYGIGSLVYRAVFLLVNTHINSVCSIP